MHTRALLVAAAVVSLTATFTAAPTPKPLVLVLRYAPEGDVLPAAQGFASSRKIAITQVTDARGLPNPMTVGENRQGQPIPIVASTPPTAFAMDALRLCFKDWGIPVASDGDLSLTAELVTLFAVEANKYRGEARVHFRLTDSQGGPLWEGITAGEDFTWGRSLNPENYNQVLSNALRKAYAELVENKGFQAAWAGKSEPSPDRISPDDMKATILKMMADGIGTEVIASYVRRKQVSPGLTAEQILEWKRQGIPELVITAALVVQAPP